MSKERLRVEDRREQIYIEDLFEGQSFDSVITALSIWYRGEFEQDVLLHGYDVKFSVEYYGYDGGMELYAVVYRDENDKEYAKRMAEEAKAREKKRLAKEKKQERARKILAESEEAERAEYERLKAKFGE